MSTPKSRNTEPVSSAPFCTASSPGPYKPDRKTPNAIRRCLQKGLKDHGCRPHHEGSCSVRPDDLEADCAERPVQLTQQQSLTQQQAEAKRLRRKARGQADRPATDFTCVQSGKDCHSRIGLSNQTRSRLCFRITTQSTP